MRIFTVSVVAATLSLGMPAFVQAQGTSPQSNAQESPAQSGEVIRSIQVVDVKQLQPDVRAKVDELVAQTSEEDLKSLRESIDATPEAASIEILRSSLNAQPTALFAARSIFRGTSRVVRKSPKMTQVPSGVW